MGIRNFTDRDTKDLACGVENKRTRKHLPKELHRNAIKKIQIIRAAKNLEDVANFPGLKFEKLKGHRKDEYSIRINIQYRICFRWKDGDAYDVSIVDYH
ncbi:MAG: type II toxin-antitoxin system RelE/ParE family toxin [bacterium]|nr:type II toxin-antitoxin system RelE/ParE family toxin [bacterium]